MENKNKPLSTTEKAKIFEMYVTRGESPTKIAEELDRPVNTIYCHIAENNLKLKKEEYKVEVFKKIISKSEDDQVAAHSGLMKITRTIVECYSKEIEQAKDKSQIEAIMKRMNKDKTLKMASEFLYKGLAAMNDVKRLKLEEKIVDNQLKVTFGGEDKKPELIDWLDQEEENED